MGNRCVPPETQCEPFQGVVLTAGSGEARIGGLNGSWYCKAPSEAERADVAAADREGPERQAAIEAEVARLGPIAGLRRSAA
jgi:hypothetical protein